MSNEHTTREGEQDTVCNFVLLLKETHLQSQGTLRLVLGQFHQWKQEQFVDICFNHKKCEILSRTKVHFGCISISDVYQT